jgi:hypothetical protein
MANRKILAIITALVMLGGPASSQQAASISELRQIEQLVAKQRWAELYNLIMAKPALTQGNDPLSLELRDFVRQVSLGRVAGLAPYTRPRQPDADPNQLLVRKSLAAAARIY